MTTELSNLEICDRLSRSLARARLREYGDMTVTRLDRLDHVLESCGAYLAALDAQERAQPQTCETPAGGYDAPNVILFPVMKQDDMSDPDAS